MTNNENGKVEQPFFEVIGNVNKCAVEIYPKF